MAIIQGDPYGESDEPIKRPLGLELQGFERHVILSDYHHRNYLYRDWANGNTEIRQAHDTQAMRVVERFMTAWEPTHIHYLGDMIDFYSISRFCEQAPDPDEIGDSLSAVRSLLRKHRQMFPKAEMVYYLGNHEWRWEKYLAQRAPALVKLADLTYNALFRAGELSITIHPYRTRVSIIPGVLELTHGDKVRAKSGMTAQAMLEKGVSGVSGHTHRLGQVYRTTRQGTSVWLENGCLCSLEPDYLLDPDWQQGISLLYVDRESARFHADQVPIIKGRMVYGGKVYEADADA